MGSASRSSVHPARVLVALCAALITALALPAPPAQAQESRFDVLVWSRTTGFRHTEAIDAGKAAIAQMGTEESFAVTASEDPTLFTDAGLRPFEVIVFLNPDGEGILNASQRTAFERWMQQGGGLVSIHASANADRDWAWMGDMMGGAWFLNHPSGALQFQQATVNIEDATHPATANLPNPWVREDEWYNFTAEPTGKVHVLLSLDENSYDEQDGSPEADDHPIAWCSNYDGGRNFYTALGHHGTYWSEPAYQAHILGAIEWASGEAEGDCGEEREGIPTDAAFDKVALDDSTENPMELAVAENGEVFYVELAGRVKHYDPEDNGVRAIGTIPVHRGNENGLLGITLDPDFETNRWLYLFYSPPSPEIQRVSRFTVGADGNLDMASEEVLLEFPHQRIVCCHSAGSMTFGPDGNLYISTGDDTEHAASNGYAPLDDDVLRSNPGDNPDADRAYDSRRTSGNTNDLRGKIIRIRPKADPTGTPGPGNTYDIPAGNLFGIGGVFPGVEGQTRPEIYTMGHRNPFRIQVDQETGWVYNGEVGPDAGNENPSRGPRGYDELNQIRQAGNMGWPYCIADNKPYVEWTFPSGPAGAAFDCAGGPANTSSYNTGLAQTPPTTSALLWWPYSPYPAGFPWNEPPTAIPTGPGRTAIAGPIYHFDPDSTSETKFPAYYDDKVFFADWSRDWIATLTLDAQGQPAGIEEFMPNSEFRHPHDMEMGADGNLYLIEWGRDFNYAGAGINPDSGLYRIEYAKGTRTPVARASADKDSGPAPLTVAFSSEGSTDDDGDELTFEWEFDDGTPVSNEPNPTHVFEAAGTYNVRLTVTDSTGKSSSSTVVINAGNTRPTLSIDIPQGGVYDWGDRIAYTVTVTDPEDGATIDCERVNLNAGIFHDEGGNPHVHPGVSQPGCSGTVDVPAESGHAKSANIALVLVAAYTDRGGAPGSAPLEGGTTRRLTPKVIQAEHHTGQTGLTNTDRPGAEGGVRVTSIAPNDWLYFEPISLKGITGLTFRYTAGGAGGLAEVRLDAPDGPLVGTADLPTSGGANTANQVTATLTPPDEDTHRLYLVFRQRTGGPANNMFELDELSFVGKGVATDAAPSASITADAIDGPTPLTVNFTGSGVDPEGTALTFEWDFTTDGTVDATGANVSHTYTTAAIHKATLKVTDATGRSKTTSIDIDAYAPVGSCPGDDDFSGTTLNRDLWTVTREVPADLTLSDGRLDLQVRSPDIFGGSTGMENIVQQPLPASGPWTATVRMTFNPTTNFQNAGILIYDGDERWIKFGHVWNAGRKFELYKELANSPTNLNTTGTVPAEFPTTFQMRLVSDGTVIRAQYSPDGQTWTNMGTAETNLDGFTAPTIGVYGTAGGNTTTLARFDWFKLDSPADPNDEFDGDALDLCRWTDIVRHDPTGYEVSDGQLRMPAAHGDFFGAAPNDNPNIVLQPAPSGEWMATTRLTFNPNENYEQAGIVVYGDDANYAKADLVSAGGARVLEFLRETNDSATGFGGSVTLPQDFPTTVEIRVTSDGTQLNAHYRPVGGEWEPFGDVDQTPLAAIPNPRIGIYANDGNQTVTSREEAAFDFFRIGEEAENAPPVIASVAADPVSGVAPLEVDFSAEVSDADGDELSYSWDFDGDGEEDSSEEAPSFTYAEAGVYEAELTVSDGEAEDSATVTVTVTGEPSGGEPLVQGFADPSSGAAPLLVRFSATALDPDGGALSYRWDVEGVGTVFGPSFSHTFMAAGEYTATVTVTDDEGDTASDTVTITVGGAANQEPTVEASAEPTSGAAPLDVEFDAVGNDPDGPEDELSYAWDFGDGGASFDQSPAHSYLEPGTYTATVTVEDAGGASGTDTVEIVVGDPPGNEPPSVEAGALPGSGPAPLSVLLSAAGTDPDGDELSYEWEFGDDSEPAEGQSVRHTYTAAGTYTATVTASDGRGGSDAADVQVVVGNPPANQAPTVRAAADPGSGTAPLTVRFTSAARDPDGDPLLYVWEFGDGGQAGGASATHTYGTPGTYTATITVTDPDGATGTGTIQVTVNGPQGLSALLGDVAGARASISRPSSLRSFRKRGVRVTLSCESTAAGRAALMVSQATAKRLRLGRRTLASRAVACETGHEITVRLKPARALAKRLTAATLKVTLRLSLEGADTVQHRLTIRSRR